MIDKELVEQWVQDVHAHMHLGMAPVFHTHTQVKGLCELAAAHGAAQAEPFAPDWVNYRQGVKDGAEQMRDRCAEVVDANANTCVQDSLLWIALNSNAAAIRSLE